MATTKLLVCNLGLRILGAKPTTDAHLTADDTEEARQLNDIYDLILDETLTAHPWNFTIKRAKLVDATKPDVSDWATDTVYAVGDDVKYGSTYYNCLIAHTSDVFSVDLTAVKWETITTWITATTYLLGDKVYHSGVHYTCKTAHTSGTWATDLNTNVYWVATLEPEFDWDYAFLLPSDCLRPIKMKYDTDFVREGDYLLTDESEAYIKYIAQITDPTKFSPFFTTTFAQRLASEIAFPLTNSMTLAETQYKIYLNKLKTAKSIDGQEGIIEQEEDLTWLDDRA